MTHKAKKQNNKEYYNTTFASIESQKIERLRVQLQRSQSQNNVLKALIAQIREILDFNDFKTSSNSKLFFIDTITKRYIKDNN